MPKRSNIFQRIVNALYSAIKPEGGIVTESVELYERTSGIKREVDILAEMLVYGMVIRIAIEVRGRSKKEDVRWIDELIGKFRDLPVDKVVAVTSSGFSEAARTKAQNAGIEFVSAIDVPHHNWSGMFHRLGIAMITRSDSVDVQFTTSPRGCKAFGTECSVLDSQGAVLGTIEGLVESLADQHRNWITEHLRTNFFTHYKTVDDLHKQLVIENPGKPRAPMFVRTREGSLVELASFTLRSISTHTVDKVSVRHVSFDNHLVSAAEVSTLTGERFELFATQFKARPNQVTIRHCAAPGSTTPVQVPPTGRQAPSKQNAKKKQRPA